MKGVTLQYIYLSYLGIIFFIAFVSYYVQYPGLLSSSGIQPSHQVLPYAFPIFHNHLIKGGWIDTDSFCEILQLFGMVLSLFVASGYIHNGIIFFLISYIYGILRTLGQVFYSFQWDILLIETGIATSFCLAPWKSLRLKPGNYRNLDYSIGAWPLRFLLFKLMFMSGVVKVQANCPTWLNLTALEYHFATQCLPGPFAWFIHQLHPFLLRLAVGATLVIEIPLSLLLISPTGTMRTFAVKLQVLLQIMIMLTGNYNFFNLLTVALCIICLDDDNNSSEMKPFESNPIDLPNNTVQNKWYTKVQNILCWVFLLASCFFMLKIESIPTNKGLSLWADLNVKMIFSIKDCNKFIEKCIPWSVLFTWMFLTFSLFRAFSMQSRCKFSLLVRGLICALYIGVLAVPSLSLTRNLQSNGFIGSDMFIKIWQQTNYLQISNGYGLFRRMTGVGVDPHQYSLYKNNNKYQHEYGWAGLPPSIVARPEIILEALIESTNSTENETISNCGEWRELNFRWKPGNVKDRPRQIAPHQPRLDWQMWFAALGNYQQNHWLLNLVIKMLQGCQPVLNMIDEPELLNESVYISKIRAKLFEYDFTRLDTSWNRRIPGAELIANNKKKELLHNYWTRKFKTNYLPEVDLHSFRLSHEDNLCDPSELKCHNLQQSTSARLFCETTTAIRRNPFLLCTALICTLCTCIIKQFSAQNRLTRKTTKVE